MSFTIGMINKVQRETDQLVRCQTILKYLKLLDVKESIMLIQYIIYHNVMTISEVLHIFKLYLFHLDEVSEFSNVNNIMFCRKPYFVSFQLMTYISLIQ